MENVKKYICEAVGTCFLVLFGCGTACITAKLIPQAGPVIIPLAFGLSIVAMAYAIGHISGCHLNPAVSIAMLIDKRMSGKDFACYLIAQFIGAFIGAAILCLIIAQTSIGSQADLVKMTLGTNGFDKASTVGISMIGAIIVEIILTFVFVFAVLGVTSKKKFAAVSGIVIGLTLTFVHILGVPLTGTSVNPARSFGPALMTWLVTQNTTVLTQLWVFIVSPLAGGALAAGFWRLICTNKKAKDKVNDKTKKAEDKVNDKTKKIMKDDLLNNTE